MQKHFGLIFRTLYSSKQGAQIGTNQNGESGTNRNKQGRLGNEPNTVSESTVSNTELSEFFGPDRVPGRELSEFRADYDLCVCVCVTANSPSLSQNSPSLPQNSPSSLL